MNDSVRKELKFKERSLTDLARFIDTRNEGTPNYSLLLGAGCSVSSGIRPATQLVSIWRREIVESLCPDLANSTDDAISEFLSKHHSSWYDRNKEYASLFERRYDLQPQRRRFIENEVAGKKPSIGYAYLTALVGSNHFNTIFTTNFDDLLNEAFFQFSDQRPIICAHDSSINGVTVTSRRPKIIKLHGDYLFDDIKATARETESLEQNMRLKFTEFAKDSGLVVVGYAGGDRSIMDVLSSLLRSDDYFKTGVYWCIRKDSEISDDLKKLLWKDRVYFVTIDGFDEVFGELYSRFNGDDVVPISTNKVSNRNSEIIRSLIENKNLENSPSAVLQKAYRELSKETTTNRLYELFRKSKEEKSSDEDSLDDPELIALMEAEELVEEGRYAAAIDLCKKKIGEFDRQVAINALLKTIANAQYFLGQYAEACATFNEIIAAEPKVASHYLSKARYLRSVDDKMKVIEEAFKANPYWYANHLARGRVYVQQAQSLYGEERVSKIRDALSEFDKSIERNPSGSNSSWFEKFNALADLPDREQCKNERQKLISTLSKQSPQTGSVLNMRMKTLTVKSQSAEVEALLDDIADAESRAREEGKYTLAAIRLNVLGVIARLDELRRQLDRYRSQAERNEELGMAVARLERRKFGNDAVAIEILKRLVDCSRSVDVATQLINALIETANIHDAESYYANWSRKMNHYDRVRVKINLLEAREDFGAAINEANAFFSLSGTRCCDIDYLHICAGNYEKAEIGLRERLEMAGFSVACESEIVNYELAKIRQSKKVDKNRLGKLMEFTDSDAVKAACHILQGHKNEALQHIKESIREDMSQRYDFQHWPVFLELRSDSVFQKLVAVS